MKITRSGGMITVRLPGAENAVVCGSCGFPFRANHMFGEQPRQSCPRCGAAGPFRKATDADFSAYVESRRAKPSDYLKVAAIFIVVCLVILIIAKWTVDA